MSAAAPGGEDDGAVGKGTPKGNSLVKQIEKWTPVVADMLTDHVRLRVIVPFIFLLIYYLLATIYTGR